MGDEAVVVAVAAAAAAAAAAPARATVRVRAHYLPLAPCTALLRAFSSERPAPDNFRRSPCAQPSAACPRSAGGAHAPDW